MSIVTDEQIQKWRDRWNKHPGLADEVAEILMGTHAINTEKSKKLIHYNLRMWEAHSYIFSKVDSSDFEKFDSIQIGKLEFPVLDLRGINWSKKKLDTIAIPYARFDGALLNNMNLNNSELSNCNFQHANLSRSIINNSFLSGANFYSAELELTYLKNANMLEANLDRANLTTARLQGTNFRKASIVKATFKHAVFGRSKRAYQESSDVDVTSLLENENRQTTFDSNKYLPHHEYFKKEINDSNHTLYMLNFIKHYVLNIINKEDSWFLTDFTGINTENADFSEAGDLKRYILDQQFLRRFRANHPFWYKVWNALSNCGWSWKRLLILSLFTIFLFAGLYGIPYPIPQWMPDSIATFISNHGIDPNFSLMNNEQILNHAPDLPRFWQLFYISFDIFTNLGIRTTFPMNGWGVAAMFLETVLGFVALGMLISVLTNRFARRS